MDTFLVVGQFGASIVYIILISTNIRTVVDNYCPQCIMPIQVFSFYAP